MAKRRMPQSDRSLFTRLSQAVAHWAGRPQTFLGAATLIVLWALSGPFFGYNDTWQLVVNTSTTIVTFLMVFIIQNSQNRDGLALQIKLDEIIRAIGRAQNIYLDLENRSQEELDEIKSQFEALAAKARARQVNAHNAHMDVQK